MALDPLLPMISLEANAHARAFAVEDRDGHGILAHVVPAHRHDAIVSDAAAFHHGHSHAGDS